MKPIILSLSLFIMLMSCSTNQNPFFADYQTPYGAVPFDQIKMEHYEPAFMKGMEEQAEEIEAIASSEEVPDFENTIAALDASGELLSKVQSVFFSLLSNETNEEMQALAGKIMPLLSEHSDNILLNEALFDRIRQVYENRLSAGLNTEQVRLTEITYKDFVRSGAALDEKQKEILRELNKELSVLDLEFSENVLKETNAFKLIIDNQEDLAGLPQSVIDAAAETATEAGMSGKWVFTLHNPSRLPFLQYAENRALREKILKAYAMRGDNDNENDNKEIINRIINARIKKAKLLGYQNFAVYKLEDQMAKTPSEALKLMDKVWERAIIQAKTEAEELQEMIRLEGNDFQLEAWDWWYYAEKLRKAKYDLDEAELKPYFKLENVREGVFMVANKLYGLTFKPVDNVPVYHPDVEVFEVNDADGSYLGLFYTDYFPRPGKGGGAWMSNFKEQYVRRGENIRPHIYNVGNFTKPTADTPSLLSIDEVETMFHEFGHALHGMLSQCTYKTLSGTGVPRDFVEMPSQIMENWCMHPQVLKLYAKHYQTGEVIPDELIAKIEKSSTFNQGFTTVEFLSAAYLDMFWHTLSVTGERDVRAFETGTLNRVGLIPEIIVRYRSTYFNHIFYNDYCAGYYAYLWAEVLDADAFNAFVEHGIFDQKTAISLRKNILEKGNSEDPMLLYRRFRGQDPDPEALLKRRGL